MEQVKIGRPHLIELANRLLSPNRQLATEDSRNVPLSSLKGLVIQSGWLKEGTRLAPPGLSRMTLRTARFERSPVTCRHITTAGEIGMSCARHLRGLKERV